MERLEFKDLNEVVAYFAKKLNKSKGVKSTSDINSESYKKLICGELIQQYFVIKEPTKVLSTWNNHKYYKWWMYAEILSEILNLDPPIMYKYKPEMFEQHYNLLDDGRMQYIYGSRWNEFNQLVNIYNKLKKNPNSKRCVIQINMPYDTEPGRHDSPCTCSYHLIHRNGKLNMTVCYRSWDFFGGFKTYDFALSSFILQSFCSWLGMKPGNLAFYVNSLHYYNRDKENMKALITEINMCNKVSDKLILSKYLNIKNYYIELRNVKLCEEMAYAKNFEKFEEVKDSITCNLFKDMCNVWKIKNCVNDANQDSGEGDRK